MQSGMHPVRVECRSDFRFAQKPVRIEWAENWVHIEEVLDEAGVPDGWVFTVMTTSGQRFMLKYLAVDDIWLGIEQ